METLIKSIGWAVNGIANVWKEEINFRIEILAAITILFIGNFLSFTRLEWVIIAGCVGAVLSAEILNTAIEDLCNKVEPNTDTAIGKIKDMMGGFVLIVSVSAFIIGIVVISNHL